MGSRAGAAARCTSSTPSGGSWAATGSSAGTCPSRPGARSPRTTATTTPAPSACSATARRTRARSGRRRTWPASRRVLEEAGLIDEAGFEERDRGAIELVDNAVEFADASPEPALESLYDNVYVLGDQVQGWYSVDERTPEVHRGEDEHEVGAR